VFYCLVGRRSPALVSGSGDTPLTLGAQSLQNVIGGFMGGLTAAINWVAQAKLLSIRCTSIINIGVGWW
jgi:hypothetical protein